MSLLVLNGSPSAEKGNCQILAKKILAKIKSKPVSIVHLANTKWTQAGKKKLFAELKQADGFIFITGTYWDSWGSPLQIFLENVTELEGSETFLGKPAAVFVLNHSVGGKGVLSRLQAVLNTFGCLIPPMSGMVYSWTNEQLLKKKMPSNAEKDLWSLNDMDDILENLQKTLKLNIKWKAWPVDKKDFRKVWLR